jgi:hypothetical protein
MTITELIADNMRQNLEWGYGPDYAKQAAVSSAVYTVLDAAGLEGYDTHTYWNTDVDFYADFNQKPSPAVLCALELAVVSIWQATGVRVHLSCSQYF